MQHDYGLIKKERLRESEHWKEIPHKKVVMCNVDACKNRITVDKIARRLKSWNVPKLEQTEAFWLTEAVVNAINANESTADISKMFNIQVALYTSYGYAGILPREAISRMLYETIFKKINETDDQITVKLNWWCLL